VFLEEFVHFNEYIEYSEVDVLWAKEVDDSHEDLDQCSKELLSFVIKLFGEVTWKPFFQYLDQTHYDSG
jgi:hypothetical protein